MGCGTSALPNDVASEDKDLRVFSQYPPRADEEVVSINERSELRPDISASHLPYERFYHGQLGVTSEEDIERLRRGLRPGELYSDPDFPATDYSLFFDFRPEHSGILWRRPHELTDDPEIFKDGIKRSDVVQGAIGDCWFISSCAAVAQSPALIHKVIPPGQTLKGDKYQGLIVCRFWRFGEWVSVCIDDRLPSKNKQLVYARCSDSSEFWLAFLEKAYAKLHGTYEGLVGGQALAALVDLTGGLAERTDIKHVENKDALTNLIKKSLFHEAFVTASLKGDFRLATNANAWGLVEGHAYTITGMEKVEHEVEGTIHLIRVRNPWANSAEWSGAWKDGDPNWDRISSIERARWTSRPEDGEFCMSVDDFFLHFEEISMCLLGPDFEGDGRRDSYNQVQMVRGHWATGVNAGGSRNDLDSFATNPQYALRILDGNSRSSSNKNLKADVIIGLMQEHRRSNMKSTVKLEQIGFSVYKHEVPEFPLPPEHFRYNYDVGSSGVFINYREVIWRHGLDPGNYVIIPCTFLPNCDAHFLIRVYSSHMFSLKQLT